MSEEQADAVEFADRRTVDGRVIERVRRPRLAKELELEPHPEGGWYRRTWTAPATVQLAHPLDGTVERPAATLILFHLPAGEASAWHRVGSSEIWIWNGPGTVSLQYGGTDAEPQPGRTVVLGDPRDGLAPQAVIAPDVWQRTLPADHDALVSCVVSPGFDFADFTMPGADGRTPA